MNGTPSLSELLSTHNRAEIARRLEKSRGTVSRWATGETVPSVADLPKLAEILRIDVGALALIIAADSHQGAA